VSNVLPLGAGTAAPAAKMSMSGPERQSAASPMPRLIDMLVDPTPERMVLQLTAFRSSVQDSLSISSKAYRLLVELEKSGLADCAPCTEQLRTSLQNNPHYIVLKKLEEAERLAKGLVEPLQQG
jgi:hypothetical protein